MALRALVAALLPPAPPPAPAPARSLFPVTDPAVDGAECLRDCDACGTYPRGFRIDEADALYGGVKGWGTHLVVGTGKTDWVRDVADERGSVMEAVARAGPPENGRLMLSASDLRGDGAAGDYSAPTTALLLPAFVLVRDLVPSSVPALMALVASAPTTASPLGAWTPTTPLRVEACPHRAVVLMCSQRTRDARCGQSAPVLRREMERHLRPLGLWRDLDDARPGGVGVYLVSHVGGHKYSANVLVYRRRNAFGEEEEGEEEGKEEDGGAAQCIWLARVRPEDCENLVRFTVLRGKVVKPERQLRGGFDRARGVLSW